MTKEELIKLREAKSLTKKEMAALLGVTAMVYGRYEKGSLAIPEKVAAKADSMVEKESESVDTVSATGAVDNMAEEVDSAVEQAVDAVREQPVADVAEKQKAEKPIRKGGRKAKKTIPQILIESKLGGQISTSEIMSRIPAGVDKVFIKPEENKAYWIKGDETGDVELWG